VALVRTLVLPASGRATSRGERIGLSIATQRVHAVLIRRDTIVWRDSVSLDIPPLLSPAVNSLLSRCPCRSQRARRRVTVAVGMAFAQVKRLVGLPRLGRADLQKLVDVGVSRFFVTAAPVVVAPVRLTGDGVVWAAILDRGALHEAQVGAEAAGCRIGSFVPAVAVLGGAAASRTVRWVDSSQYAELEYDDEGRLTGLSRGLATSTDDAVLSASQTLAALGSDAAVYAAAYAAACASAGQHLSVRTARRGNRGQVAAWRVATAATMCAVAMAVALWFPVMRARRDAAQSRTALATLGAKYRTAVSMERDIAAIDAQVHEVAEFINARSSATPLLRSLSEVLPAGVSLVTFRLDTTVANVVVLAPHAAALLPLLDKQPGISGAEILGAVSRELIAGRDLERASFRFRVNRTLHTAREDARPAPGAPSEAIARSERP